LESESRAAFRSAIPSLWVYRDLDQDYGIDSEVEIFDDSGSATGARFLVQLKATDQKDLQKALRLRLPLSKAQYYSSLDLPVLIVRFHAPTGRLYARWFHSLDPYYGRPTQTGISFQFSEHDIWEKTMARQLAEDVEAFREMKSPRLHGPLRFSLLIAGDEIHGVPSYQLRLNLREAFRRVPHIAALDDADNIRDSAPHAITINSERCEIRVGGTPGMTLHTSHGYAGGDAGSAFHCDVMLCIGLALDCHGHSIEGAALIELFWKTARLPKEVVMAYPLARCLARANRMQSAMEIAEEFFRDDSTVDAAQNYLLPFLARQPVMAISERDFLVRVLGRIALEAERRGDLSRAAMLNYNCGNALRDMRRLGDSIHYYRNAGRLDAQYLKRAYYWRELAGVMFFSRRYALSAKLYKRSLDIQDHRLTRALYADALMFSGKYKESQELFAAFLTTDAQPTDAEWALKCSAMAFLRKELGIDEQRRRPPLFPETFEPADLDDEEIVRICRSALEQDALSPIPWFNLGSAHLRASKAEYATRCFLMAALVVPWDLEAWGNVIGLSMQMNNAGLLGHALTAAYMINGEAILNHLANRVPTNRDEFVKMLAAATDLIPRHDKEITLRYHCPGTHWDEIKIPSQRQA
jgi:tetratricopeptide (TPR) repeat protein